MWPRVWNPRSSSARIRSSRAGSSACCASGLGPARVEQALVRRSSGRRAASLRRSSHRHVASAAQPTGSPTRITPSVNTLACTPPPQSASRAACSPSWNWSISRHGRFSPPTRSRVSPMTRMRPRVSGQVEAGHEHVGPSQHRVELGARSSTQACCQRSREMIATWRRPTSALPSIPCPSRSESSVTDAHRAGGAPA